jgi:hypothetical protein
MLNSLTEHKAGVFSDRLIDLLGDGFITPQPGIPRRKKNFPNS